MRALIGHTGFIGKILSEQIDFNKFYNSSNIESIIDNTFDEVYCAAPTGSRIYANNNAELDLANTKKLINILKKNKN